MHRDLGWTRHWTIHNGMCLLNTAGADCSCCIRNIIFIEQSFYFETHFNMNGYADKRNCYFGTISIHMWSKSIKCIPNESLFGVDFGSLIFENADSHSTTCHYMSMMPFLSELHDLDTNNRMCNTKDILSEWFEGLIMQSGWFMPQNYGKYVIFKALLIEGLLCIQ